MNVIIKTTEKSTRICGFCHQELPIDSFYRNKQTNLPDSYCKECRKSISNVHYRDHLAAEKGLYYPVITDITDRDLRLKLIRHALEVVRLSIERRNRRRRDDDYRNDSPDTDI